MPASAKHKNLLITLALLWLCVAGWSALCGDTAVAVFTAAAGALGAVLSRRKQDAIEPVEYFVTDRRTVVHTDEDGKFDERVHPMGELPEPTLEDHGDGTGALTGAEDRRRGRGIRFDRHVERDLVLRAIGHAQRVFEQVQRARGSARGTSAE